MALSEEFKNSILQWKQEQQVSDFLVSDEELWIEPSRLQLWLEAWKEAIWRWVEKIKKGWVEWFIKSLTPWWISTQVWQLWAWLISWDKEQVQEILETLKTPAGAWAIAWVWWEAIVWALPEIWEFIAKHTPEKLIQTYNQAPPEVKELLDDAFDVLGFLDVLWVWPTAAWLKAVWRQVPKVVKKWLETVWRWVEQVKWITPLETVWKAITRDIPESVVKRDLGFTPTQRAKIEKIVWKTEWQYVLEKWLAWKWKEELATVFAKQADDMYQWITRNLGQIQDVPKASEITTQALEDILDQLTSTPKLKRAYAKDIEWVQSMLAKWEYTLSELNNIRRAFDKVNTWMFTAQWKARSWIETAVDVDIRNWIAKELQEWAERYWIDVKEMNKELRAWIEMKEALLNRLSQEQRNNLIWLQDIWVSAILSWWEPVSALALIWAKKYWEAIAPAIAQKLFKLSDKPIETSRLTRGIPITTTGKPSKLGLVDSPRVDSVKPSKKVKLTKFDEAKKTWLSSNKTEAQKQIIALEKEITTAKSKWLKAKVEELTTKLKKFVEGFIEWFKEKPKGLKSDITWWVATRVGQGIEWWIKAVKNPIAKDIEFIKQFKTYDDIENFFDKNLDTVSNQLKSRIQAISKAEDTESLLSSLDKWTLRRVLEDNPSLWGKIPKELTVYRVWDWTIKPWDFVAIEKHISQTLKDDRGFWKLTSQKVNADEVVIASDSQEFFFVPKKLQKDLWDFDKILDNLKDFYNKITK